jgi:uncharacterized membrane protein
MKKWFDFIVNKFTDLSGGVYQNRIDPNFMVPKASPGVGWNINFGNPKAVISLILMIIVIMVLIIGSILIS